MLDLIGLITDMVVYYTFYIYVMCHLSVFSFKRGSHIRAMVSGVLILRPTFEMTICSGKIQI